MEKIMELRDFELEIIDYYKRFGKGLPWKGLWIRGHLLDVKMMYVYSMYKSWRMFCDVAAEFGAKIKPGDYQSFRTYFHLLKQLGLVRVYLEFVREGRRVVAYELVPEKIDDPGWRRPFQIKYPRTDWKAKTSREKHRLRKKYPRGKGRRRGRPPKYFQEA